MAISFPQRGLLLQNHMNALADNAASTWYLTLRKEYHYYYCPTGKKHGCTSPAMVKESDLTACVQQSLKAYIDNVASLETLLAKVDEQSINRALVKEYSDHITSNERRLQQAMEFKARLYENLVSGTITKDEYAYYKVKYTKQADSAKESIKVLKEKIQKVLENQSERNHWISHFTQFSTMETLDRKALVHMVKTIKVISKTELDIDFTYKDEYERALKVIQMAGFTMQPEEQEEMTEQRKAG